MVRLLAADSSLRRRALSATAGDAASATVVRRSGVFDQSEIDALVREPSGLATALAGEDSAPDEPAAAPALPSPAAPVPPPAASPDLGRIQKLRVPVIVRLAQRQMAISHIRGLSIGAIIEFEKSVEEPLDLLVNNRQVGRGVCVKVGENFGVQLTEIADRPQRVRSLGA